MSRPGAFAITVGVIVGSGCGASTQADGAPLALGGGVAAGPTSGLWGDGSSTPTGMHIGCIRGRRLAVLITVTNRTKRTITLLGGGGPQRLAAVIERVAVQVRLASPPPNGDAVGDPGLRSWSARNTTPVPIPAGRSAWVQSNFLMRDCGSLRGDQASTLNRSITLAYSADGRRGTQRVAVAAARIILTRGPLHPKLPINQVG
jgi:hypothetical protein